MQIRQLSPDTLEACVAEAAEVLGRGGVILYPTDTLYGLGADALSDEAVDKIYAVKGRPDGKPIHGIASDLNMIEVYGAFSEVSRAVAEKFFPGALTLILQKHPEFNSGIAKDLSTIAFRIPDNAFCIKTAAAFGRPFTATSANTSGQLPARTVAAILAQLGDAANMIDVVFDAGELPERKPSTVIDASLGELVVLRDGAIPPSEILAAVS